MSLKQSKPWEPDQVWLLPPSPRNWLSEDHLVYFLLDVIRELDVSAIERKVLGGDPRGEQPWNTRMMLALLIYGYCTGVRSSRKIERATYENVGFRVLAGNAQPDHSRISAFRKAHLAELPGLFLQVLRICQKAGLVKLGHVSLDGTKIKANASKHKAMSHERMVKREAELAVEIANLLAQAAATDTAEDAEVGKSNRGDELPKELKRRESRLEKIREARKELEAEAKAARERELAEREAAKRPDPPTAASPPKLPTHQVAHDAAGEPKPKAQRNFTDPDSRIMKQGSDFQQAYNAQNVVDSTHQIIIAADVTNQAPDVEHLPPMIDKAIENVGAKPDVLSADAGYWSAENDQYVEGQGLDAYIAIRRQKHNEASAASAVVTAPTEVVPPETTPPEAAQSGTEAIAPTGLEDGGGPAPVLKGADEAGVNVRASSTPLERKERMRAKLGTEHGKALYARRKAIVEPPFGHIKANRGFRQFLLRGIEQVRGEWIMACMCHNLLKLFVAGPEAKLLGMATR